MTLIDLANPTRFLSLTARVLPRQAAATAILLAVGLYQSALAPDDYQQGATVKIMFIHVPNAWLSMFVWGVMSIASLGTLVWRHPVADFAEDHLPVGCTSPAFRFHYDLFKDNGHFWRSQCPWRAGTLLHHVDHAALQYDRRRIWRWFCAGDYPDPILDDHDHAEPTDRGNTEKLRDHWRTRLYGAED